MKRFLKDNGLSICLLLMFLLSITGQVYFGLKEYNKDLIENGAAGITLASYFTTGHFLESTFENWESEFLQMAALVVLTIFLQQKGSSESKDFDKSEEVDREPNPALKNAPWPVKAGGWILSLYKYSLTIALILLFILSFALHFYGSFKDENLQQSLKGYPPQTVLQYAGDSRFWFESFQNWQSEFLSVFAIIILSIFLRQKGSTQSKPVDAPTMETGE